MKKEFMMPEVKVMALNMKENIATSGEPTGPKTVQVTIKKENGKDVQLVTAKIEGELLVSTETYVANKEYTYSGNTGKLSFYSCVNW